MKNQIKNLTYPGQLEANISRKAGLEDVNHNETPVRDHPKVACSRYQPIAAALLLAGSLAARAASLDSDAVNSESAAVPSEHTRTRSCACEHSVRKIFATVQYPE